MAVYADWLKWHNHLYALMCVPAVDQAMMLCRHNGHWYIAVRGNPESSGCTLRAGIRMPSEPGFERRTDWMKTKEIADAGGVQFYPTLRYRGHRVYPEHWHPESERPLLMCVMESSSWRSALMRDSDLEQVKARFESEGWEFNARDQQARKYIDVDDLEKVEGPAPDGQFLAKTSCAFHGRRSPAGRPR
jgi:hypothetical protein